MFYDALTTRSHSPVRASVFDAKTYAVMPIQLDSLDFEVSLYILVRVLVVPITVSMSEHPELLLN
jgi:hypothetical protein